MEACVNRLITCTLGIMLFSFLFIDCKPVWWGGMNASPVPVRRAGNKPFRNKIVDLAVGFLHIALVTGVLFRLTINEIHFFCCYLYPYETLNYFRNSLREANKDLLDL